MAAESSSPAAQRDSASPSRRRHGAARRRGATTALAAAMLALAPAAALGQVPGGPPPPPPPPPPPAQPVPLPAVPPPPRVDESVLVDAPARRPDPGAPRATLGAVLADLQALAGSRRSAAIGRAARAVIRAQRAFGDTPRGLKPTHLAATTTALVSAQRALASARATGSTKRLLARIARRLDGVARRIARDLLTRVATTRAPRRVVSRARARLALGDRLALAADHTAATKAFGKSVKTSGNAIVFDPARFEQNIRGFFDTQTTGYSYAIVRSGVLYAENGVGFARTPADTAGGGTKHSATKEVNLASVTKTITAAAVLKLMEKNKLDLDESIAPFLPKQWQVHSSIQDLTFKDLMTQRSGLGGNAVGQSTSLATLQAAMALGVKDADKTFVYQNANLGIFRVIIPGLLGVDIYGDPNTPADVLAAKTYVDYLKTQVFDQNGTLPDCKPKDEIFGGRTLAYAFPDDGKPGVDMGDWTLGCGGGGLHLSAHELARFLARLRFTNQILSPLWRERMNADFLGFMDPTNTSGYAWANGTFGVYRAHGGDLNYGTRGVDTCAMNYSIAVQAVVLINSRLGNYPYQCAALAQAFDAAWVAK